MPRKCDTCKHFRILYGDRCSNREIAQLASRTIDTRLDTARDICDRESNGIFVYFEPKTPAAGGFVQVCRHCGVVSPLDGVTADPRCSTCNGHLNRTARACHTAAATA